MPNPLRDELTDEVKRELAAVFADMRRQFPPVRFESLGGYTFMRSIGKHPWQL